MCVDPSDERKTRSLLKASKNLRCEKLVVLPEGYEVEQEIVWFGIKGKIKFVALWKWLLE